jgi:hypothetical protein
MIDDQLGDVEYARGLGEKLRSRCAVGEQVRLVQCPGVSWMEKSAASGL